VGENWSFGANYKFSQAVLNGNFPGVASNLNFFNFQPQQRVEGILNTINLYAIFNHPCGFFAEGDANWYSQHNIGFHGTEPGDDFWQLNAFVGYRFWQRHAEASLGVLNITDRNYRLNPLNIYNELPRERTLAAQLKIHF
jgi:outer membrane receptor for ferric coprogen and ferric-rhodotorulic acid